MSDDELLLFSPDAYLENVILPPLETVSINFQLKLKDFDALSNYKGFSFDLIQIDQRREEVVGGERFDIRISRERSKEEGQGRASNGVNLDVPTSVNSITLVNNPTKDWTGLKYVLAQKEEVSIELFNTNGQLVKTLVAPTLQAKGQHEINFNTTDLPKGVYIYKVLIGKDRNMKKLIVQ